MTFFSTIAEYLKTRFFSKITAKFMIAVVSILSVALILVQYFSREDAVSPVNVIGAVIVPFQKGVNELGDFLFDLHEERLAKEKAWARIDELEQENITLRRKASDGEAAREENVMLRKLLNARQRLPEYEMEEADVIGNSGINFFERFTINKGTREGIRVGMNVINADGLVGIVSDVGYNYAVVTSIIEDGMNVSAMTRTAHENCVVSGDLSMGKRSEMQLRNALLEVDLSSDNALVTSTISDRFLPNLLNGYAENVHVNPGELTQSGTVRTAVDFTKLRTVLVITTMKEELKEAADD